MKQYHISIKGQQSFVKAEDVLKRESAEGKYPRGTLIWYEGLEDWEPIEKHFTGSTTPPPLPTEPSQCVAKNKTSKAKKTNNSDSGSKHTKPLAGFLWLALFLVDLLILMFFDFDTIGKNQAIRLQITAWLLLFVSLGKAFKAFLL